MSTKLSDVTPEHLDDVQYGMEEEVEHFDERRAAAHRMAELQQETMEHRARIMAMTAKYRTEKIETGLMNLQKTHPELFQYIKTIENFYPRFWCDGCGIQTTYHPPLRSRHRTLPKEAMSPFKEAISPEVTDPLPFSGADFLGCNE